MLMQGALFYLLESAASLRVPARSQRPNSAGFTGENAMIRERALKIVLVLVGVLFSAAILPVIGGLRDPANSDTGDTMMMGLYATLGIFLLIAVRRPSAHRSLIAFTAWSSFAHAAVMSTLGLEIPAQREGFLVGSALLVLIGVVLIVLAPKKQAAGQASASA
jgi:hypothetical protein